MTEHLVDIQIPEWLEPIYTDYYTFIVLYGGRGGAKSFSIADYLLDTSFNFKNCYLTQSYFKDDLQINTRIYI